MALLRYRHIPYRYTHSSTGIPGLPEARPRLLPTFYLPDAQGEVQAVTDSTPLIRRFEAEYPGRSVIPQHPVMALLDALLNAAATERTRKLRQDHQLWRTAARSELDADIARRRQVAAPRRARASAL